MNIIGLDALVFGVDDVAAAHTFLTDYGLIAQPVADGQRYEALDGTAFEVYHQDDPNLPAALPTGSSLRKTIYGVANASDLDAIAHELEKDRAVRRLADGSIESTDDMGFVMGFQVTVRKSLDMPAERVNAPGDQATRALNHTAVEPGRPIHPRTLSHVVYFVPDAEKAEQFYVERLGFRCTDRLLGAGPFLQPGGTYDHHTLFLIQTPPFMQGIDHCTFHFAGPSELIQRGTALIEKGYQSFWGPGRHNMGSNWFWYFNSPLGCKVELDADMDLHDASWEARAVPMSADASQAFLLQYREKWAPGGKPAE